MFLTEEQKEAIRKATQDLEAIQQQHEQLQQLQKLQQGAANNKPGFMQEVTQQKQSLVPYGDDGDKVKSLLEVL